MIFVKLTDEKLCLQKVADEIADVTCGGTVIFQGSTRNIHKNDKKHKLSVEKLEFQCYKSMAMKELHKIGDEIQKKWPTVIHVSLHHKIGDCPEGDPCVIVGVCSPHRKELFDACDFGITELKRKVPIWKREIYHSGAISEWKENCECI